MQFLLDTNICIHAIKGHPNVLAHLQVAGFDACAISSIVLAELSYGIAKSASPYKDRNAVVLREFISLFQILPWAAEAAWAHGPMRQCLAAAGTPIGEFDLLIAAQAVAAGLVVVTNNTREFERIEGLKLENWVD